MIAILDASALLAVLLGEPGGDRVRKVLPDSGMSDVNLSEVIGHFARNGATESDVRAVLDPLPIERHRFDDALAYATGLLLPVTKPVGPSFGDRACIALAQRFGVPVITADRAWRNIEDRVGIDIEVIR